MQNLPHFTHDVTSKPRNKKTISLPESVVDLYSTPHRGLRWALGRVLELCGRTDFERKAMASEFLGELRHVCKLISYHLAHEERWVHPLLAQLDSTLLVDLDEEHAEHRAEMNRLLDLAERTISNPSLHRELYLNVARFVVDNFVHMELEETTVQRLLDTSFDSETLRRLHDALIASIEPHDMIEFLQVILPGMNPKQRVEFLSGPRQAIPPQVFQQLVEACVGNLEPADADQLLVWARAAA